MAIVKLSSSGKAIIFVDDEGNVFGTSLAYMYSLLYGNLPYKFLLLSRLPIPINKHRFKKSPLYIPQGMDKEYIEEQERRSKKSERSDPMGSDKELEEKAYADAEVW